ncbi:hypothetical protein KEG38_53855 [Polyangium jinanense]|uniref:MopE-related protein n=1 Tax=Polyangium jinanense TaxID=2829994 RepID=UPI0023415CE3|nr:MopE-related protein [Polyangium jinanense]MDC3962812.1 hypothetical protein [Polyangium jinanense]
MGEQVLVGWAAMIAAGLLVGASGCARGTTPEGVDENLMGSGGGGGSGSGESLGGSGGGSEPLSGGGGSGGSACDIPEVCNGIDDDCDGKADEDIAGLGSPCNTGLLGVCIEGVSGCDGGESFCSATIAPTDEVCDGLDNDCDGETDEDNPGSGGSCDTGELGPCAAGIVVCAAGALACMPSAFPQAEVCGDLLDNDCNGQVDEGCNAGPPLCAHDPCTPGDKLDPLCDPCVNAVCVIDKTCCKSAWDVFCVGTAQVHCACP